MRIDTRRLRPRSLFRILRRPSRALVSVVKLMAGVGAIVIMVLLYPSQDARPPLILKEGSIARRDVLAPFTFTVYKNEEQLADERREAADRVAPSFDSVARPDAENLLAAYVDSAASILTAGGTADSLAVLRPRVSRNTLEALAAPSGIDVLTVAEVLISPLFQLQVVGDREAVAGHDRVLVLAEGSPREVPSDSLHALNDLLEALVEEARERLDGDEAAVAAALELGRAFLGPNLFYNSQDTERRREQAAAEVSEVKGSILEKEAIVEAHRRVTADDVDELASLAQEMARREGRGSARQVVAQRLGNVFLVLLAAGVLISYLVVYRKRVLERTSHVLIIATLVVAVVAHLVLHI